MTRSIVERLRNPWPIVWRKETRREVKATMSEAATLIETQAALLEECEGLLERHIQRCRDAVAECPKWSPAQAEWSRARDALLNFRDDYLAIKERRDG